MEYFDKKIEYFSKAREEIEGLKSRLDKKLASNSQNLAKMKFEMNKVQNADYSGNLSTFSALKKYQNLLVDLKKDSGSEVREMVSELKLKEETLGKNLDKIIDEYSKLLDDHELKTEDTNDIHITNKKIQSKIKKIYEKNISLTREYNLVIENTVSEVIGLVGESQVKSIRDALLQYISNFEQTLIDPGNADVSSEQFSKNMQTQLTYNTIYCIIASELTMQHLNKLVTKPADKKIYVDSIISDLYKVKEKPSLDDLKESLKFIDENIYSNLDRLKNEYESEIDTMLSHLLSQHRFLLGSNIIKFLMQIDNLPFLNKFRFSGDDLLKWENFAKEYLLCLNHNIQAIYHYDPKNPLSFEFKLAKLNDKKQLLIRLGIRNDIEAFNNLHEDNIEECINSTAEIINEFNQSTKKLIQVSEQLLRQKGDYLTRVLDFLEQSSH